MSSLYKILVCTFFLASCSTGFTAFPVKEESQTKVSQEVSIVRLSSKNIQGYTAKSYPTFKTKLGYDTSWSYKVGVGDILSIVVYDHPELSIPVGPEQSAIEAGFRVQADGAFFYPHIGSIKASGRTIENIRNEITQRLKVFIPDPQVVARIAEFNSQEVVVSGEVKAPNTQALNTVPLTLLQAINAAGGYTEDAELSGVTLQRNGRKYVVDLDGFLVSNYAKNNPILRPGDIIYVPERPTMEAYILGEVDEPNVVDLAIEPVSLTQALTLRGGLDHVRADARGVFVFRNVGGRATVYQLETTSPSGWLLGTQFNLLPKDVVYVTRAPVTKWNDAVGQLLPTVLAVGSAAAIIN